MNIKEKADQIANSNISLKEKVKELCKLVMEIPYKRIGSVNPEDMVKKGMGSCTPKHIFLASYLRKLGVPVKFVIAHFYYKKLPVNYPKSAKKVVEQMPVAYHLALKAELSGRWTLIDVTWDSGLKGFSRTENWDGISDMKLAVVPEKIVEIEGDPREYEKGRIKEFSEEELKAREKFYKMFNEVFLSGR